MAATVVWTDKKRTFLGLPWSFTRYTLTEDKLLVTTGFFRRNEEEVRLYRILDVTLRRSLWQRILGLGTVHCCSADHSTPEFDIENVKKSHDFKELFSDTIEACRLKSRVGGREVLAGGGHEVDDEPDDEPDDDTDDDTDDEDEA